MHNWMRPEPIETTITRLGRSGYDGIETRGAGAPTTPRGQGAARQARPLVLGVGDADDRRPRPVHEDHDVRLASVQYVKDCLSLVASLGGKILTVVPSTVGKVTPMASPEEEWEWCVQGLKECQAHAEQVGVRMGSSPQPFRDLLHQPRRSGGGDGQGRGRQLRRRLDIFHMNIEEADWRQAIREERPVPRRLSRGRQQPDAPRVLAPLLLLAALAAGEAAIAVLSWLVAYAVRLDRECPGPGRAPGAGSSP